MRYQRARTAGPIVFAETRRLAEEWTYRWLAAALEAYEDELGSDERFSTLTP